MSLRAKLLTAIVFVNLVVLGALFYFLHHENRRVLSEGGDAFRAAFTEEVLASFAAQVPSSVTIAQIIGYQGFGALCRDALVLDNPSLPGREPTAPFVQVNPMGAWHRDPASFPRREIIDGIRTAMEQRAALPMHGGYCMPIEAKDERLIGGGWFVPQWVVEPRFPSDRILLAIGLGVILLAGILFIGMERWVVGPLAQLSETAGALERGEVGAQVGAEEGTREIVTLVRTLNRASRQIETHQSELLQAVDDATERARRRERELILSQRMAALGTLAAGIAHEINNPLAGMMNAVNRLKRKAEGDGVYLELLEEGLERIRQIVRRTLEFAPRTSEPVSFHISRSVDRARALVAHRMDRANVEFVIAGRDDDEVRGDPHELTQVFLNLFLNSLDVLADSLSAAPEIMVRITSANSERGDPVVRVEVADNGPGADEETLARIFDPFFSTKGATSTSDKLSSGLGMSISYSIVEQHGGTMRVASPPSGGFVVTIELPRSDPEES